MPNTRFEGKLYTFDSMDYHFEQIDYISLDRIQLKTVEVQIPGGEPKFYRPQLDTPLLKVRFAYVGHHYSADIDPFASKLYNERKPTRMILAEHRDRFYPVLIVGLPTEAQMESLGFVELDAQMIRSFAFRRWKDSEITPRNTEIDFSMPIVPGPEVYTLDGSRKDILYYNEGVGLKPVFEITGVNHIDIYVGDRSIIYQKPVQRKLILDMEHMTATDGVTDMSSHLFGDTLELPNGFVPIRFVYYPIEAWDVLQKSEDERAEDFLQGSDLIRVSVPESDEEGSGLVQLIDLGDARLTRNSTGYDAEGKTVSSHQTRFADGRFGQALMIESSTTQMLNDGGFAHIDHELNSGITQTDQMQGASNIVRARAEEESGRVMLAERVDGITAGQTYTAQVKLRSTEDVDYLEMCLSWIAFDAETNTETLLSTDRKVIVDVENQIYGLSEDFELHSLTATAPEEANQVIFYPVFDGGTPQITLDVEATQPMLSEGTRIPSWHLSGTRAHETLSIPQVLNEAQGEVSIWCHEDGNEGTRTLWDTDGDSRFSLYKDGKAYKLQMNGEEVASVNAAEIGWHRFSVAWNKDQIRLSIDHEDTEFTLESDVSFADASQIFIGCDHTGANQFNGRIDDFRISDIERTAGIEDPSPVDLNTVYKLSFDGNLQATTAGQYTSRLHDVSIPSRRIAHIQLSWREIELDHTIHQSIQMEAQAFIDGIAQGWKPIGNGGKVSGIDPGKIYSDLQIQYRATLIGDMNETRSIKLESVKIEAVDKQAGQLKIHSRKRFV